MLPCGICGFKEQLCLVDCTWAPPGDCEETAEQICYPDADGDGFGDPGAAEAFCECPEGMTSKSYDCDDADENVHPEGVEECNGIDDDCDDEVDEGVCPEVVDEGATAVDAVDPPADQGTGEDTPPRGGDVSAGADSGGGAAEEPGEVTSPAGNGGCSTSKTGAPAWPVPLLVLLWLWARRKGNEGIGGIGSRTAGVVLHRGGHDS